VPISTDVRSFLGDLQIATLELRLIKEYRVRNCILILELNICVPHRLSSTLVAKDGDTVDCSAWGEEFLKLVWSCLVLDVAYVH